MKHSGLILIASAIGIFSFSSCTQRPTFWANPAVAHSSIDTLEVYFQGHAKVDNPDDVLDDLGSGDAQEVFEVYFLNHLQNQLLNQGAIKHIVIKDVVFTSDTTLSLNDSEGKVFSSFSVGVLPKISNNPSVVINNIRAQRLQIFHPGSYSPGMNGAPGMNIPPSNELYANITGDYIVRAPQNEIWAYGSADGRGQFSFVMDSTDWNKATSQFAEHVLRGVAKKQPQY